MMKNIASRVRPAQFEQHSPGIHSDLIRTLYDIIKRQNLTVLFQPIINFSNSRIIGFEGLIRGPSDSLLHSPTRLFGLARQSGIGHELENLCCKLVAERFVELQLQGLLFLNRSSDVLAIHELHNNDTIGIIRQAGLEPARTVIELTENKPVFDFNLDLLLEIISHYSAQGFQVAIDDQGDCFSTLGDWPEVRPSFVKIDRHFIQNIDKDPVKAKFVKFMQEKAEMVGCQIIAEGIETHAQLLVVQKLGIPFGQGYHITRPTDKPSSVIPAGVVKALTVRPTWDNASDNAHASLVERRLMMKVPCFLSGTINDEVFNAFESNPDIDEAAIIQENGAPIGLISRSVLIDRFARPYRRELYGKKPCTTFMDPDPLIVDINISIQELSHLVAGDRRHLSNGFIFTENGKYVGIGTGHDLIREITDLQIQAARYANPLTGLPGNTPINEYIDKLLEQQIPFVACYCDLDHFKPFNDVYGFSKGDAMIQMSAKILAEMCDPELDFLGHIGGDDFIALFCSPDWEARCRQGLENFGAAVIPFFSISDNERGGYVTENRRGEKEFNALTSLSIGAVKVSPGMFSSHMEVSSVAADAKKMAKKMAGNSLYVNMRSYPE